MTPAAAQFFGPPDRPRSLMGGNGPGANESHGSRLSVPTETNAVLKIVAGLLVGLGIGAGCRYFDVPSPAPPKLLGAVLVVAMTTGYLLMDQWLSPAQQTQAVEPAPPSDR